MKTQNKLVLMYILMFIGITLNYGPGWASEFNAGGKFKWTDKTFICTEQGPGRDKTVEIQVNYKKNFGVPHKVEAFEIDDSGNSRKLKKKYMEDPYYFGKSKYLATPKLYAFPAEDTGPALGAIICTENQYPFFIYGKKAWFFKK